MNDGVTEWKSLYAALGQSANRIPAAADYDKLAAECSKVGLWCRAALSVGYDLGWRLSEIIRLEVRQYDRMAGTLRVERTKNKKVREVGLPSGTRTLLDALVTGKRPSQRIFTRDDGSDVIEFRNTWHSCCVRARLARWLCPWCKNELTKKGRRHFCATCDRFVPRDMRRYQGLLFHDLRRSFAMDMTRAGEPQHVIMHVAGWLTDSMFRRYAIVETSATKKAVSRLEEFRKQQREEEQTAAKAEFGKRLVQVESFSTDSRPEPEKRLTLEN